ncbi:hypothetical protein [Candidatus Mycolicibacterium alkanivorans]|uniref:hypothetical protein n=1 Tax=Candidatus Mycolicibacterium alkanivorans TaxID=2954114 RepID=UPI00355726B1
MSAAANSRRAGRGSQAGVEVCGHRRGGLFHRAHADDAAGEPVTVAAHQIGFVEALTPP